MTKTALSANRAASEATTRLKRLDPLGKFMFGLDEGDTMLAKRWRKWTVGAVSAAALIPAGCVLQQKPGAVEVTSQAVPGMTLSQYRTYAWKTRGVQTTDPTRLSELEERDWLIRNAVDEELRARGLMARPNDPQLVVDYRTDFKFKETETLRDYREYRQRGGTDSPGKANVFGHQEAILTIFLLEPGSGRLLWRGAARGVAWQAEDPSSRLREAIRQIFQELPT
jgi:hypothetical protein